MKFKRINYKKMKLDADSTVSKTYVTLVQDNKFQQVNITPAECRSSVRVLSRLNKKNK